MHSLDPTCEKPESEVETKEVQVEEANPEPEQGKLRCITPQSLTFILNCYLYFKIDCALG
jgi:hypothetical protein